MTARASSLTRLARWLDRLQPGESPLLIVAALLVGLGSGAGVWLFKRLIDLAHAAAFGGLGGALAGLGLWTIALVPAVGGIVVGLIAQFLIGEERHHGVAGIMEAVALAGGRLRYGRIPAKAAAFALSIGAGASAGGLEIARGHEHAGRADGNGRHRPEREPETNCQV